MSTGPEVMSTGPEVVVRVWLVCDVVVRVGPEVVVECDVFMKLL